MDTTEEKLRSMMVDERAERLTRVAGNRLRGVTVVLENLTDPHNGGACLRTIEAMGLLDVHVVGDRLKFSDRVTQGCEKWLNITQHKDIESCVAQLKQNGFAVYAAVPSAKAPLESLDAMKPAAFLMGNEVTGLTKRARELADVEFTIPLHGFSESVNLSVATALTVYTHATRRRTALGVSGDLSEGDTSALRLAYFRKSVPGGAKI